jgi:hypothetical protein
MPPTRQGEVGGSGGECWCGGKVGFHVAPTHLSLPGRCISYSAQWKHREWESMILISACGFATVGLSRSAERQRTIMHCQGCSRKQHVPVLMGALFSTDVHFANAEPCLRPSVVCFPCGAAVFCNTLGRSWGLPCPYLRQFFVDGAYGQSWVGFVLHGLGASPGGTVHCHVHMLGEGLVCLGLVLFGSRFRTRLCVCVEQTLN